MVEGDTADQWLVCNPTDAFRVCRIHGYCAPPIDSHGICKMRSRPSARLLVIDPRGRVLLFRFVFKNGALAGQDYWATPGGGVEDGETFEQAAVRELEEETGIRVQDVGPEVGQREFVLQLPDGERVRADERYFLVRSEGALLSRDGWTALEVEVMVDHRWWSRDELAQTSDAVWPENLLAMLTAATTR